MNIQELKTKSSEQLIAQAKESHVKGTDLLAAEGVNGTISGTYEDKSLII